MNVIVLPESTSIWECLSTFEASVFVDDRRVIMGMFGTWCAEVFVTGMAFQFICLVFSVMVRVTKFYHWEAAFAFWNDTLEPVFMFLFLDTMHLDTKLCPVTGHGRP